MLGFLQGKTLGYITCQDLISEHFYFPGIIGIVGRLRFLNQLKEAEEIEDEEDQAALMKALELSMAQPELEQGMSHDYESLGLIEERHLKSDTYWIHTLDNGQVFEGM